MNIHVAQIESNLPGEDRFQIKQKHNIFSACVLDGHGGYLAVDIALTSLLDIIIDKIHLLPQPRQPNDIVQCIDEGFVETDIIIRDHAIELQNAHKRKQHDFYDFGCGGFTSSSSSSSSSHSSTISSSSFEFQSNSNSNNTNTTNNTNDKTKT